MHSNLINITILQPAIIHLKQICVERGTWSAVLRHFLPRPVIKHVTDHYTADAAADNAAFIILSPLTDKQAFSAETCRRAQQNSYLR